MSGDASVVHDARSRFAGPRPATPAGEQRALRFGEFELSPERYELRRAGRPLHLEPRVFEVLAYLVAHRDRVVLKCELLEVLWRGEFVSESALTAAVRNARRALGDSGSKSGWIQTVHGRGFRFAGEVAGPAARRPSGDAYRLYLQGCYHWNKRHELGVRRALVLFDQARAADPACALAEVGVAKAYAILGFYGWLAPREAFPHAREAAERALALAPELADAHATRAYCALYFDWDFAAAEAGFRRALALDQRSLHAHHFYFNLLTAMARFDDALAHSDRTLEIEPLWIHLYAARGWIHYFARRYDAALRDFTDAAVMEPGYPLLRLWRGWTLVQLEDLDAAVEELRAATQALCSAEAKASLAAALALRGEAREARGLLRQLRAGRHERYVSAHQVALAELALGDREAALDSLESACELRDHAVVLLGVEPRLDPLRDDRRFARLRERCAP